MIRGVVHHDKLTCGVDGMGGEVYLPAMDAVSGRTGRVWDERANGLEGKKYEQTRGWRENVFWLSGLTVPQDWCGVGWGERVDK